MFIRLLLYTSESLSREVPSLLTIFVKWRRLSTRRVGHAVERRTVNRGDGGSIPPTGHRFKT